MKTLAEALRELDDAVAELGRSIWVLRRSLFITVAIVWGIVVVLAVIGHIVDSAAT
jgi:preprotein translocase subunit SecE